MDADAVHPTCESAAALVPSYLDGELSEAQASPLRTHLLQCPACREVAKDLKSLKRWFVEEAPVAAPPGFAARVARRAFAGDPGLETAAQAASAASQAGGVGEGKLLTFVLRLTAAAAAVLLLLAAALQMRARPTSGDELEAEDLDLVWEEIYGLEPAAPEVLLPPEQAAAEAPSAARDDAGGSDGR